MIEKILEDIEKNGWFLVKNFLSKEEIENLNSEFSLHEFKAARVGLNEEKKRVEEIRGDYIAWVDVVEPKEAFRPVVSFLNELKIELNRKFFLGIKEFECHLASYPSGAFYKKHLDQFSKDSSRAFSFIFYLNQHWNKEDGGELILFDKNDNIIAEVLPMAGSVVGFLSEEFPHEVKKSNKERRSLTGWMHRKTIY